MTKRRQAGFTLIELLVVVAVIGILAAIALTIYSNVHQRTRLAKAQADGRALATAVSVYAAHVGSLPTALSELTAQVTNAQGYVAGPFILALPAAPTGWSAYAYSANGDGRAVAGRGDRERPVGARSHRRVNEGRHGFPGRPRALGG